MGRIQPGSLDAEAGIYASVFDLTGSRLITCEADKSIKIWKENSDATEDRCLSYLIDSVLFLYSPLCYIKFLTEYEIFFFNYV